ncbi:MAG: SDR family NAD(P)-dependent oxidoreductase [Chitinivibrionales bacterium]|nr:SDR family NAD(P)-dependent oxidoreductase [Chitinivibrionales bacterium]
MADLSGKTAFISASTAGIGYATASALAARGAEVFVNGRTQERVHDAVERLCRDVKGCTVAGIAADLATPEGAAQVIDNIGAVDILVNNLGATRHAPFADTSDSDWEWHFQVNVMSGVRLTRAFLPRMVKSGWGRIVFVSSVNAVAVASGMIPYSACKAAICNVARGIAEESAGTGVTANSILVGATRSEGLGGYFEREAVQLGVSFEDFEQEFFAKHAPTSLLKRLIKPGEVAHLVTALCAPEGQAINGAALRVDGGVVRHVF